MTEQFLWKTLDVAQYLGIPLSSVYKMTGPKSRIRLPHIRIAGKVRFRKDDIDRWLEQFAVINHSMLPESNAGINQEACGRSLQF
jgi:excisionase family DNA binding protein